MSRTVIVVLAETYAQINWSFPSGFPPKIAYACMHATFHFHLILFDFITLVIFVKCKYYEAFRNFLQFPVTSISFLNIFLSALNQCLYLKTCEYNSREENKTRTQVISAITGINVKFTSHRKWATLLSTQLSNNPP
jgi:hypothetical protein